MELVEQVRAKLAELDAFQADIKTELATLSDRCAKALQLAATGGGRMPAAALSASADGEQAAIKFAANQELVAWIKAPHTKQSALAINVPFATRAKAMVTKAAISNVAPATAWGEVAGPASLPLRIIDLIPTVNTTSGAVIYTSEKTFTPAADLVPETTLKPESTFEFENKTVTAAVIATIAKMSLQALPVTPPSRKR